MSQNNGRGSRSSGEFSFVSSNLLDVADVGSLWNESEWKDVSSVKRGLLSGIDELTLMHSFDGYEVLSSLLEFVWVSKDNLGKRSTSTWVMDNILDDSLDVPVSFNIIDFSELSRSLSYMAISMEDRTATLSLS